MEEHYADPFNDKGRSTDIAVYICYVGEILPICRTPWNEIADSDLER